MKIDNRKVNGQITIEREDIIQAWTIMVHNQTAGWFAGIDKNGIPVPVPAQVAGAYIKTALAAVNPVQFAIMTYGTSGDLKTLPMAAYAVNQDNTKLSIDIGEIIAGVLLEIALPSGAITVKKSK